MAAGKKSPVSRHRAKLQRQGVVRVEINVNKADVALVRGVAAALADPDSRAHARATLQKVFTPPPLGLKALLAAAPLEDIDLERPLDYGRPVDL